MQYDSPVAWTEYQMTYIRLIREFPSSLPISEYRQQVFQVVHHSMQTKQLNTNTSEVLIARILLRKFLLNYLFEFLLTVPSIRYIDLIPVTNRL